jgi:hypothetical protein
MVDQHGWDGAFEFPHLITQLPQTEDSFAWLVARLHPLAPLAGKQNELMHLSGWFAEAPVEWLGREIDGFVETLKASLAPGGGTVRSEPTVFPSTGASFDNATKRLALHQLTNRALRTRANHLLDRCPVQDSFPRAEVGELELIAKTLAARGECLREAAGEWLDFEDFSADGEIERNEYRAGFALMLLTEGRVKAPLGSLLDLLAIDWDWMNEWYAKALSASADAMSISELLAVYPMLEWFERLYSGGVIGKLLASGTKRQSFRRRGTRMMTISGLALPVAWCCTGRQRRGGMPAVWLTNDRRTRSDGGSSNWKPSAKWLAAARRRPPAQFWRAWNGRSSDIAIGSGRRIVADRCHL